MKYFPIFQRLNNSRCLFVGGGKVALRKAKMLEKSGIKIDVISPAITSDLKKL